MGDGDEGKEQPQSLPRAQIQSTRRHPELSEASLLFLHLVKATTVLMLKEPLRVSQARLP